MPTASNSPAKACAGHEANRTRRLDQPPSPVTQIHRPAKLATRAASFRYGGRHHSGIPRDIIPLYPGDFVGIRRLSDEERERLEALIRKGKSPAQRLLKARILLKADVSEAGAGWSDSRIIKALDTSVSMVYRVRKQLVEEGFEAALSRKQRATPAVARIFDGEKEAKLIALACSKPPKGRARWTLRLLEKKVVELQIVDRASNSTIGRTLKKTFSSPIADSAGSFRRRPIARS